MKNETMDFTVELTDYGRSYAIYAYTVNRKSGQLSVGQPVTFSPLDENVKAQETMLIPHERAQRLMDELWKAGVRPSDIGTPGHLAAVQYHLEDMRKLIFVSRNMDQVK